MEPIGVALAILAFLLFVVPAALLPLIGGSEPQPEPVPVATARPRLGSTSPDRRIDDGPIAA